MTMSKQKLLIEKFRKLSQNVGRPLSSWKVDDAVIKIYRGKDLYEVGWPSEILRNLIFTAREMSNLPYGRPIKDKNDDKSAIYICSATYPSLIGGEYLFVEEWLSLRLTPGNGYPRGTGDLEIYTYRGESVENIVKNKLFQGRDDFLNFIVASSRMCGCKPYFKNKSDEKRMTTDFLPKKIKHTALFYSLMSKYFLTDYLYHLGSKYITTVIIDQLVDKVLSIDNGTERYGTHFTYAHDLLGVAPEEIKLNRSVNNHYAYRYPTYFLNSEQLVKWLEDLTEKEIIARESVDHYLKAEVSFYEIIRQPHLDLNRLRNLYKLFMTEGKIFGSSLTGVELRNLSNTEVGDGPKLRITPIDDMASSIEVFLTVAGVK